MAAPPDPLDSCETRRHYQPLVVVLVAVCVGVTADRWLAAPAGLWWLSGVAAWIAWCVAWKSGRNSAAGWLLLASLAGAGGAWHHACWNQFRDDEIGLFARETAQPACVELVVASGPRRIPAPAPDPMRSMPLGDRTRLVANVTAIRDGAHWRHASGRTTLLVEGHLLGIGVGQRLQVFGSLSATEPAGNPGEFDFARHARGDRQLAVLRSDFPDCVIAIGRQPAGFSRLLDSVRRRGDALLWRHLDPKRSGLASAVLLGSREQLDNERTEAFMTTGTIHIISISGLHVGLLSLFLFQALRFGLLSRPVALVAVAVITTAYTLIAGAEPPAVRATVMVIIACGGLYWGTRPLAFNSLAAAAILVLAYNPSDLFRTGMQLSFLSVGCLAWLAPYWSARQSKDALDRLISRTRPWPERAARFVGLWLWRATVASTLIWCVSLPLVMARYHLVSPAALVLNTLMAVPVFVAMASGFALMLGGVIFPPAGALCGWLCDLNLRLLDYAIIRVDALPWSHRWVAGPDDWWLAGFYLGLALIVGLPKLVPPRRWCVTMLGCWTAIGAVAGSNRQSEQRLDCTFASVGHGCSVVVELPSGQTLLYDAGRLGSPAAAVRGISGCLWSRGITHLDAVVLSHADLDHYRALPELLDRFSVGVVYVSPVMFEEDSPALRALAAAIEQRGIPVRTVWSGDLLRTGGETRVEVLHPPERGLLGSDNANSIVLAIEHRGQRILLTGDLEPPGLQDVMAESPYDCDVLLAPHHGSAHSDPPGLAAWSTPEWVIISGGRTSDYSAVEQAYEHVGAQVLHTAEHGAVMVSFGDSDLAVQTWRSPSK